jgi:hypothetical protein
LSRLGRVKSALTELKIAESSAGVNIAPLKRFVREQALHDTSIDRAQSQRRNTRRRVGGRPVRRERELW